MGQKQEAHETLSEVTSWWWLIRNLMFLLSFSQFGHWLLRSATCAWDVGVLLTQRGAREI